MSRTIIVPISGGKDSQVVLSLVLDKFDRSVVRCVHQDTGFDHPHTYVQLEAMEKFYNVTIEKTDNEVGGMISFLRDKAKYFPNSAARGCTLELNQKTFAKWLISNDFNNDNCEIWFGMRAQESTQRKNKYGEITSDDNFVLAEVSTFYGKTKKMLNSVGKIPVKLPIVEWTTEQVFEHIANEKAPLNKLYDMGHLRVGCYPCILSRKSEWQKVAENDVGRKHMEQLIELEDLWASNGNPRKCIKVHPVWDVRDFLKGADVRELSDDECGWCSI